MEIGGSVEIWTNGPLRFFKRRLKNFNIYFLIMNTIQEQYNCDFQKNLRFD